MLGLLMREDAAAGAVGANQLAHDLDAEHVSGHPIQRLQVAQAAAALLDVGLHQERRLAIAMMAGVALGLFGDNEAAGAGVRASLQEPRLEQCEQPRVAGQPPGVDQRSACREIPVRLGKAFVHRPRRMADLEAQVPKKVQHELDGRERRRRWMLLSDEQQVDIAERRQHAAAIASGGDDRHRFQGCRI